MKDESTPTGPEADLPIGRPAHVKSAGRLSGLTPELVFALRAGYRRDDFAADLLAGLTVAALALPLSLAIAIGSGADPAKGVISSIVGGVLVSALGGTRFQIGGPAAAFIVVIGGIVARQGYDGLLLASIMAGFILIGAALLQIGTFAKYVPGPVILGFTSGLGVVIAAGQLKDFFGLSGAIPTEFIDRMVALWAARGSANSSALLIGLIATGFVLAIKSWRPRWPGLLIAIVATSAFAWALGLPVATVGSQFGAMPASLPLPAVPSVSVARIIELMPTALTMAFLIGMESLLSATAADALAGTRHRPNTEIFAQGVANIVAALFSGLPITGVIARTGANIQAGARTPLAGVIHAATILFLVLVLAPLVAYLALPCLAAVLLTVSWRLMDVHEIRRFLATAPRDDAIVCALTLGLTIFFGLNVALGVGVGLAAALFMHRMAELPGHHIVPHDPEKLIAGMRQLIFRGPMFFGQSSRITDALRDARQDTRVLLLDLGEVPLIDATAIDALDDVVAECRTRGCTIIIAGLQDQPRLAFERSGFLRRNDVTVAQDAHAAVVLARTLLAPITPDAVPSTR